MRTRALLFCAVAALSLAACSKKEEGPASAPAADAAASAPAAEASTTASPTAPADVAAPATPAPALSIPQLAYAYQYALAAPPKQVRKLVSKHEAVCWVAGPTVCQVVGSNVTEDGPDRIEAKLTIRAQPAWLRTFRAGLDDDTRAVGGRALTTDTSSEDLSRNLVDTEAALRSRVILRDRLEETLRTRKGKVSELFEMEQQLAQVRGEIDATRSEIAMMKGRVAGSTLTISYRSSGVLAPSGSFAPVGEAAGDVVGILVFTLAFMIRAAAVLGPIGVLGWVVWRAARQTKRPKAPAA